MLPALPDMALQFEARIGPADPPTLTPDELQFIAEDEMVEIVPNFRRVRAPLRLGSARLGFSGSGRFFVLLWVLACPPPPPGIISAACWGPPLPQCRGRLSRLSRLLDNSQAEVTLISGTFGPFRPQARPLGWCCVCVCVRARLALEQERGPSQSGRRHPSRPLSLAPPLVPRLPRACPPPSSLPSPPLPPRRPLPDRPLRAAVAGCAPPHQAEVHHHPPRLDERRCAI